LRRDASLGRVAVSLAASAAGLPLGLEAEIGEPAADAASSSGSKLTGGQPGRSARLDFRGFGTLGAAAPGIKGEFEFDATDPAALQRLAALVRDVWPADQLPRTGPLRLEGQAELSDRTLRLSEVTCHLGSNTLGAGLELALAGEARLDLRIDGAEFVVDADAGGDLRRLASLPWWEVVPQGRVSLRLGAVRWREQAVARQLRLDAVLAGPGTGGGVARVDRLTATLPGAADLSLTGTLRQEGGVPSLAASLSLTAEDTRALLETAGVRLDGLPERSVRTLALTATLAASPTRVAMRDLELRLDGTRLTGSAAWVAGPRPRLALSGSADRLDLDDYLPSGGLPDGGRGGERLRDRLTALDATVDLSVARATLGELRGEGLYLRALLERGLLRLDELSVRDLAEARLRIAGTGDLPVASFELAGELESARPARLLRALGLDAPPTVTRFAPVRVTGTARATASRPRSSSG
jgi:hypothetical protein